MVISQHIQRMNRWTVCLALLANCAGLSVAKAQELQVDALWQQGLDLVDQQLDAHGLQVDRDALARIPRLDELTRFAQQVESVLEGGSIEELAWMKPELEATLAWLDQWPAAGPYASWLRQQLDYIDVAEEAVSAVPELPHRPAPPAKTPAAPLRIPPKPPPASPSARAKAERAAQSAETWKRKLAARPAPARATELAPRVKAIFREEGLPEALVWLAEVESSFDPKARSPVGAVGLFQFMPATAKRFGMSPERPDERLDPFKSARAAASYLRFLHRRFNSWPLALAGYNAGEGRVGRLLSQQNAVSFDAIADRLPLETRLYVPKIAAVIEKREGVSLASLPPPAGGL